LVLKSNEHSQIKFFPYCRTDFVASVLPRCRNYKCSGCLVTQWLRLTDLSSPAEVSALITCQKHKSVSLRLSLSTARHLLTVSLITSLKSDIRTSVTTRSTMGGIYTPPPHTHTHAHTHTHTRARAKHDCNSVQCFLTGIYLLMITNKGSVGFPSANNSEGQLQIPQSLPADINCIQTNVF
jgi:hypothetical protein